VAVWTTLVSLKGELEIMQRCQAAIAATKAGRWQIKPDAS
jgi:hypothetical protein